LGVSDGYSLKQDEVSRFPDFFVPKRTIVANKFLHFAQNNPLPKKN
jgi:hypothetical protein